jgi:hypothetical protein
MKPPLLLWIGLGIAIVCGSGCASTSAPLQARADRPATAQQLEKRAPQQGRKNATSRATARQKSGADTVQRRDYDTSRSMATVRYYDSIGQGLDKSLQRTETIRKQLDAIQPRK